MAGASLVLLGTLTFTGCATEPQKALSPANKKSATASQEPSSSALPIATVSPTAFALKAEPTDKTCDSILNLQSLYDFDPNVALTPGGTAAAGSTSQTQTELGGITCTVMNLSSQEEVLVTLVKLDQSSAEHQKAEIAIQTGSNSYQVARDVPGSFLEVNGSGTAQFVTGKYWVSLTSVSYKTGVDASPLSYVVWNNLQ